MKVATFSNLTGVVLLSDKDSDSGGSTTPCNWACLIACPHVDGAILDCNECPADGVHEDMTYKEAVVWWRNHEVVKNDGGPKVIEEGGCCPIENCSGVLEYDVEGCTCHISPPCSSCVDSKLKCSVCDFEEEGE